MSRTEHQLKFRNDGSITVEDLVRLGGEFLGTVQQTDLYVCPANGQRFRIRNEGEIFTLSNETRRTNFDLPSGHPASRKELEDRVIGIEDGEYEQWMKRAKGQPQIRIFKERRLVRFHDAIVIFDHVEHLGDFIKIRCEDAHHMPPIIEQLKLDHSKMINDSYLSLMTSSRLPKWKILIQKFHQKTGELTFGITSGIMTTIGLLTGMNSATSSKIAVLAAIAVIACADSLSDSCGMFLSKLAERGTSTKTAISYALGTLAGKFLFPLTFILPIVLCDNLTTGVIIDIVWGLIALSLLTIEQALVKEESILKSLGRNLAIAITGIALSTMVGKLIAWLIAN